MDAMFGSQDPAPGLARAPVLARALVLALVLGAAQGLPAGAVLAAPAIAAPSTVADPAARQPVEQLHGALLAAMKGGDKLGFNGRAARVGEAVRAGFDLNGMAQLMVGRVTWAGLSPVQREAVVKAFTDFTVASYARNFRSFSGEAFSTLGQAPAPMGTTLVRTQLSIPGDRPVAFSYRMRSDAGGHWRIVDILLDGSISQLAQRRAEFAAVIRGGGVDALVATLKQKATALAKS